MLGRMGADLGEKGLSWEEVCDPETLRRMSSYIDPTQKWDRVEQKTVTVICITFVIIIIISSFGRFLLNSDVRLFLGLINTIIYIIIISFVQYMFPE